jgi:hypothetical protein
MTSSWGWIRVVVGLWLAAAASAAAHETSEPFLFVGASAAGGGTLLIEHDFSHPVIVGEDAHVGDRVLYTADDPSFEPLEEEDADVFFVADGTTVRVEITALGDTVAMKLAGVELDHVGASVILGTAPTLHRHPEWQLTLPEGETGCQTIAFRLTTDAPAYQTSDTYTAFVTNDASTCPSGGPSVCGDADASGTITLSDGVNVLRTAAGLAGSCTTAAVCDVDGSGEVGIGDGVNVLRRAAGLSAELACPDL